MAADGVDFVDEHDARRVFLSLLEQVAHARGADADEHLDEVRTADREERNVRFAGDRASEQGLAGSRRAHQQYALGNTAAQLLELLRLLEELDDFLEFVLGFVHAGDVFERDLLLRARRQLRLALSERERLVAAALHLTHEEDPEADHHEERRPVVQKRRPRTRGRLLGLNPARPSCRDRSLDLRTGSERIGGMSDSGLSFVEPVISDPVIVDVRDIAGIDRRHELTEREHMIAALILG